MAYLRKNHFSLSCMQNVEAQKAKSRVGKVVANCGHLSDIHKLSKNSEVRENRTVKARITIGLAKQRDGKLSWQPVFQRQNMSCTGVRCFIHRVSSYAKKGGKK